MYTHYHHPLRAPTTAEFEAVGAELRLLYHRLGGRNWPALSERVLVGPNSATKTPSGEGPLISDCAIRFNSADAGQACEDFYLTAYPRGPEPWEDAALYPHGYQFTKTCRRDYDVWVCAALIIAHNRVPGWLWVLSDGGAYESHPNGWLKALSALNDTRARGRPTGAGPYVLPPLVATK